MLNNERLDQLDRLVASTQEPAQDMFNENLIEDLDTIARDVPTLTAEIRRLWAELGRGNQAGMVSVLRESRVQSWS